MTEPQAQPSASQFVSLFTANYRRVYGFIRSLVVDPIDAEDVLQETSSVLWSKFNEFEPGTDFGAWALRVARFQVMKHRGKRRERPQFGDELFEQIADDIQQMSSEVDRQQDALRHCMSLLPVKDRQVIQMRYEHETSVKQIAQQVGVSERGVYRLISELHGKLLGCIRRTLALEVQK